MFDPAEQGFHRAALPALCQRALQHLPGWRERAAGAERDRRLSRTSFGELFAGGWLDLLSPRAPATGTGHWPTLVESARIAARACSSTGWMLALVGGHGCIARRLPAACQDRLYTAGPQQLFASASSGADSQLSWEAGGLRVNGRWRFSSGIEDATWLMLNAPCANHPQAMHTPRFLLLVAAQEVEILDSWDSCGMAATGSHDVLAHQLLVPHDRVFALHEVFAPRPSAAGTDYIDRLPLVPYLTTSIVGPLLGCAEGAYAAYVAALAGSPLAGDPRVAEQAAHCAAQLYSAGLLYDSLVSRLHDAGVHDRALDERQLLLLKRDRAYLARQCVQAVQRLVERLGASSLVAGNLLQRHWRDIQAMAAHRDLVWNDAMLACGNAILCPAEAARPA
ncbi:acyl-CoA dehydrogenase family protein [Pseudomonas sp. NPDC089530]|uniref:acyl-CoA dehydrogenase family protein n=1 Tax=Pseudomonas sp. NPDC089530 TaxID=3390651 RepID=UPI003D02E716